MIQPSDEQLWTQWGAGVKQRREANEWSQSMLAEKVGIPQTRISQIERGKAGGSNQTRMALARVFGVEVHELFPYPSVAAEAS